MISYAIDVRHLSKQFGHFQALSDVSFVVPKGGVFCILGPNGAGKTTLLRILTTVTRPTQGEAFIEGFHLQKNALQVRQKIGVVAQENRFSGYLNVWQNLMLHARLHGLPKNLSTERIEGYLKQMDLWDRRHTLPDELSGGQQRRVVLIRALLHEPAIIFLDEPTTGLDPAARLEIWKTIAAFKDRATVILTTHYMEEADCLADRILMLNHGQVVLTGTPRELKQQLSPVNTYEIVLKAPKARQYAEDLKAHFELTIARVDEDDFRLEIHLPSPKALYPILERIPPEELLRVGEIEANLEAVFLSVAHTPANEVLLS